MLELKTTRRRRLFGDSESPLGQPNRRLWLWCGQVNSASLPAAALVAAGPASWQVLAKTNRSGLSCSKHALTAVIIMLLFLVLSSRGASLGHVKGGIDTASELSTINNRVIGARELVPLDTPTSEQGDVPGPTSAATSYAAANAPSMTLFVSFDNHSPIISRWLSEVSSPYRFSNPDDQLIASDGNQEAILEQAQNYDNSSRRNGNTDDYRERIRNDLNNFDTNIEPPTTWSLLLSALFYKLDSFDVNWSNFILAIILVMLMLTTAVGNLFVIVAILIERNLRTIGNYLVLSLAIADLLVACLVMPLAGIYQILERWTLGILLCDIWTSADVFCCTGKFSDQATVAMLAKGSAEKWV